MQDPEESVRKNYDRMSRFYDLLIGPFDRKYTDAGLRALAPKAGEKILEIGYGTGEAAVKLARAVGETGKVYGIDISEKMRQIALGKMKKAGLSERADLARGNALPLPYADDLFDAIYMSFTLELFDGWQIDRLLKECRRVLAPRGRLGVVAMSNRGGADLMLRIYSWLHKTFPLVFDCRPIDAFSLIEKAGLKISADQEMTMWNLPVSIVVAEKD